MLQRWKTAIHPLFALAPPALSDVFLPLFGLPGSSGAPAPGMLCLCMPSPGTACIAAVLASAAFRGLPSVGLARLLLVLVAGLLLVDVVSAWPESLSSLSLLLAAVASAVFVFLAALPVGCVPLFSSLPPPVCFPGPFVPLPFPVESSGAASALFALTVPTLRC